MSNIDRFKYDWYWQKVGAKATNFLHAKNMPLKNVEIISIFSNGIIAHQGSQRRMNYNPQGLIPCGKVVKGDNKGGINDEFRINRKSNKSTYVQEFTNYPQQTLQFNSDWAVQLHPTQKPVALYKWLLNKYAKQGDKILDTHVGSASSLIACFQLGFDYVGFEIDKDYYEAAQTRLHEAMLQPSMLKQGDF